MLLPHQHAVMPAFVESLHLTKSSLSYIQQAFSGQSAVPPYNCSQPEGANVAMLSVGNLMVRQLIVQKSLVYAAVAGASVHREIAHSQSEQVAVHHEIAHSQNEPIALLSVSSFVVQ